MCLTYGDAAGDKAENRLWFPLEQGAHPPAHEPSLAPAAMLPGPQGSPQVHGAGC